MPIMNDDFLENLTSLTDNLNDIAFTRYVTITNINGDKTVDCKEDTGTVHKNVINTTNLHLSIDDVVLLSFVDNNIYNPMITGGVNVKGADDQMIFAMGLGKFNIVDGDLIFTLPIGVENYASINEDGDLIIDLDSSEAERFNINDKGEVIYA
jgi:hypothetical protein